MRRSLLTIPAAFSLLLASCGSVPMPEAGPVPEQIGYIERMTKENGQWTVELDPIEWFGTEEDAERAYRDDHPDCEVADACTPPHGYYIRNREAHVLTFLVSPDARAEMHNETLDWSSFVKKMNDSTGQISEKYSSIPFWIRTQSGAITMIREQFIP